MPAGSFLRMWEGMDATVHFSSGFGVTTITAAGLVVAALSGSPVPLFVAAFAAAVVAVCPRGDVASGVGFSDPMVRSVADPVAGGLR